MSGKETNESVDGKTADDSPPQKKVTRGRMPFKPFREEIGMFGDNSIDFLMSSDRERKLIESLRKKST